MRYIKKFENLNNIEYSIGDIVACVDSDFDEIGKKYTVIEIYKYEKGDELDDFPEQVDVDHITLDQLIDNTYFVTVENIAKNNTYHGIYAKRFRSLKTANIINTSNKYNL